MAFWWVNHKQTRDHEVSGGYLWSPLRNANGRSNWSYENMTQVRVGDKVFSYANGEIGAVGWVTEAATGSPKPTEFGTVGEYWADEGWLVEVNFRPVSKALRPSERITEIGPMLPPRYSPIQANGHGNQGCYLAGISDELGFLLMAMLGVNEDRDLDAVPEYVANQMEFSELEDLRQIDGDPSISETERIQLSKARKGQGLFRKRVILLDGACRVTGVADKRVLVASHIKPWRAASNPERISGYNGILLSPHVDALFDAQFITFEDDGRMHVHPALAPDVLDRWSIDPSRRVAPFRPEQSAFLQHHRQMFASKR